MQVVERDAHLVGDLGLGRRAVQLGLERGVRALDLAGLVADRARDPVDRAQLVDDRAADPADRVGLELDGALEVELLDRVDQPEDAVRDEVGLLDVRRQADADPAGDVLDQRRVVQDQPLAQALIAGRLEVVPERRAARRRRSAGSCVPGRTRGAAATSSSSTAGSVVFGRDVGLDIRLRVGRRRLRRVIVGIRTSTVSEDSSDAPERLRPGGAPAHTLPSVARRRRACRSAWSRA